MAISTDSSSHRRAPRPVGRGAGPAGISGRGGAAVSPRGDAAVSGTGDIVGRATPGIAGPTGSTRPGPENPPQYSLRRIGAVWAAAAGPMALLSWVVAPWLAGRLDGPLPMSRALILCMTAGLFWQFVLVVGLLVREQRSLRWSRIRAALWLRAPSSRRTGRRGGRLWLILVPCILVFAAMELVPMIPHPATRDMKTFLDSSAGQDFLAGSWGWFAIVVVLVVFNTVLGEELLFRGLLLPRMNGVFGRRDWIANGVLFATYHLHMPWAIPGALVDMFAISYPAKRYRSALIGIAVHSTQSVLVVALTLAVVLR
ncbi:CPBP family intramembrane metalloprotease [Frankia sp. CN7]|uniref:CPBP family intramembrane metalloprotease n=1 Tax=Frankia nepalensis TaxID=1836974 RepID=A0A937RTN8_9ACTN|nr:CPBP family intramembrane metalloprotease [Frankia nepalensis]MBL7512649.1 CPBP family intramembrane metalloprotease [Frankia nepalensis]MBL7631721.1 CPBP family intramembrane metalloprotease [Frankia nepalensis]